MQTRLIGYHVGLAHFLDSCVDPELHQTTARDAPQARVQLRTMRKALAVFGLSGLAYDSCSAWLPSEAGMSRYEGNERMGYWLGIRRYLDDLLTVQETALNTACRSGDARAEEYPGLTYPELRRFEEALSCY